MTRATTEDAVEAEAIREVDLLSSLPPAVESWRDA
jgi:hypothetical protein